jgi:hypothetical protein
MPKRERFELYPICPKCRKKGVVECEENENPLHTGGRFERSISSVSEGFEERNGQVFCQDCGVRATM